VVRSAFGGARFAIVVLAAFWVCRFLEEAVRVFFARDNGLRSLENSENRSKVRLETLRTTSTYVVRLVVAVVAVLVCMQTIGLSIAPLLATAGVASVAIGLGAQTLIRDVVAGFFVLVEDQYAVGDVIELGTHGGLVESLTLRVTKLRSADGSAIFVPNGEIKMVRNTTSEWARVDFRVRVRLQEDLPRVETLLQDILASLATDLPSDVTGKPEYLGVDKLEEKYAVLRAWVRTRPLSRHRVERELNARVLRAFGAHDVQFPSA
jgi:small conductance mechanosensitive channel